MKQVMLSAIGLSLMLGSAYVTADTYTSESCYKIMKNGTVVDETCWKNTEGVDQATAYLIKYLTLSHIYSGRAEDAGTPDLRGITELVK